MKRNSFLLSSCRISLSVGPISAASEPDPGDCAGVPGPKIDGRLHGPLVGALLFGLELPSWNQILPILLLRSLFFLLACLPVLILWQDSHRGLFLTLGLILFLLVGGLSMLQAYWLPVSLRLIHSLEILADELVYTAVLLVLFCAPKVAQ